MATTKTDIPESKIRQAIWMLKTNKTKKAICAHLAIAYNTKRLETIITEFQDRQTRTEELKKKARAKPLTQHDEDHIVDQYQQGESMSAIAQSLYLTSIRIKKVLLKNGVPIRSRKKKGQAQVEHIVQDLEIKFKIGDKVFIPKTSEFAIVKEVYDEDWIEYHSETYRSRYVELTPLADALKNWGDDFEGKEDVHWNIYWDYDNGNSWKSQAIKWEIQRHSDDLIRYGRECYAITAIESHSGHEFPRHQLFPVRYENGT